MIAGGYEAHIIANTILNEMFSKWCEIRPMKLQKLLYYTVGFTLLKYGQSPVREHFYKWTYGPVVPEIYHCFKKYAHRPISVMAVETDGKYYVTTDKEIVNVIKKKVMPYYSEITDWELSDLTHAHDAWKEVPQNSLITNEAILSTFRELKYGE